MNTVDERTQNRGRIILGVEDTPEDMLLLRTVLTAAGYTFVGARDGQECLQLVTRVKPRLILLDVEMQWLIGFEVCRRLRQVRELNEVPIVFLTARNTSFDVKSGIDAGGDDYMAKPFDAQKLLVRARYWIARGATGKRPQKSGAA